MVGISLQFSTLVAFVLAKDYRCKGYNHLKYQPVFSLNPTPNPVKLETISETIACDILERRIYLGGGLKYFLFSPLVGEDSHFD